MDYEDQKLCLDFLKLYLPDMDKKNFKITTNPRKLEYSEDGRFLT